MVGELFWIIPGLLFWPLSCGQKGLGLLFYLDYLLFLDFENLVNLYCCELYDDKFLLFQQRKCKTKVKMKKDLLKTLVKKLKIKDGEWQGKNILYFIGN